MPTSQIKYKIITKKALKPDTFSGFFEYVFDNLPESEAKKVANSFIGDLGRKYDKQTTGSHVQITRLLWHAGRLL